MHELPSELADSLQSWRGSLYGGAKSPEQHDESNDVDIEKMGDYGKKDSQRQSMYNFDEALRSSMILHPSRSSRRMRERRYQASLSSSPDGKASKSPPSDGTQKKSVFDHAPDVADPDPASNRLENEAQPLSKQDFFYLIGMNPPRDGRQHPKALRVRGGLYGKIWYEYEFMQSKFRVYDILTYLLLILQLFLSAVFIVLGSLPNTHNLAIPLLGAVSTVVAGVLALMKGQGLPNRLRMSRDSLRNCLFEAEELYWDVNANRQVYFSDIKKLREDFLGVLELARRNHPDTWNAAALGIAQGIDRTKGKAASSPKR